MAKFATFYDNFNDEIDYCVNVDQIVMVLPCECGVYCKLYLTNGEVLEVGNNYNEVLDRIK